MSISEVSLSWNSNLEHIQNSKLSKGVPALQGPQTKHRGWKTVSQGPTRNGKEGMQLPTLALEMRSPEFQPSLYCYTTAWHRTSLIITETTHEAIINHELSGTGRCLRRGVSRGLCPQGRGWRLAHFDVTRERDVGGSPGSWEHMEPRSLKLARDHRENAGCLL